MVLQNNILFFTDSYDLRPINQYICLSTELFLFSKDMLLPGQPLVEVYAGKFDMSVICLRQLAVTKLFLRSLFKVNVASFRFYFFSFYWPRFKPILILSHFICLFWEATAASQEAITTAALANVANVVYVDVGKSDV